MQEYINNLLDSFPTWLVLLTGGVVGFFRIGPKFFNQWMEVASKFREKSDAVKNGYISLLESENERLRNEIDKYKSSNKK